MAASGRVTNASRPAPTEQQQQRQPVLDQSQLWADIAAASFGADGVMDGWDSDTEQPKSSESKYLQVSMTTQQAAAGGSLQQLCVCRWQTGRDSYLDFATGSPSAAGASKCASGGESGGSVAGVQAAAGAQGKGAGCQAAAPGTASGQTHIVVATEAHAGLPLSAPRLASRLRPRRALTVELCTLAAGCVTGEVWGPRPCAASQQRAAQRTWNGTRDGECGGFGKGARACAAVCSHSFQVAGMHRVNVVLDFTGTQVNHDDQTR